MVVSTIKTGVDRLIDYLQDKDKVTLADVSKDLNIPVKTLQTWVDFLVEEKIINVEYKFTSPSIYLNKGEETGKEVKKEITFKDIKEKFIERAKKKKLPSEQIVKLWNKKLNEELEKQKEEFFKKMKLKKLENEENAWEQFKRNIMQEDQKVIIN